MIAFGCAFMVASNRSILVSRRALSSATPASGAILQGR
jgi:hypothetical protein